ncbi:MAG: hypothetical protein J6R50_00340 [Alistipes sp.]|nr:hypothetical protein [Alistipes sp.]
MTTRLIELINSVAEGSKAQFARMMGWKPQYLSGMLNGRIGLTPIIRILQVLPNLNARWLLLGEGKMFNSDEWIEIQSIGNPIFSQKKDCIHTSELVDQYESEKKDLIPVISEANEDILKTPREKERSLIHTKICSRYKELMKQFPGVKSYRLMKVIATEHSRTIPNIRKILIDYGLYSNKHY